jgi:hypothetical protein
MSNINEAAVKNATSSQIAWSAGAASFTIGQDGDDTKSILLVNNLNTDVIARVVVNSGDGMRSCLGDLTVDLAVSKLAAIPLGDSMRFKTNATQVVTAGLRTGSICPAGQVVAVVAVSELPPGRSAGTTEAGVHTFQYRFASDPAETLKRGLEQALQAGGCRVGAPPAARLAVDLLKIEAKGLSCGFTRCDGDGQSVVEVTLSDASGRKLAQRTILSAASNDCGIAFCNDAEASAIASDLLTDTIRKTVAALGPEIARQLRASAPVTPAPAPTAAQAAAGPQS